MTGENKTMHEYSYSPKAKTNNTRLLMGVLFFTAVILYGIICSVEIKFEGIIGLFAVLCFVGSILLLTRYVYRKQIYRIVERNTDSYDLVIDEITGQNKVSVSPLIMGEESKAYHPRYAKLSPPLRSISSEQSIKLIMYILGYLSPFVKPEPA